MERHYNKFIERFVNEVVKQYFKTVEIRLGMVFLVDLVILLFD